MPTRSLGRLTPLAVPALMVSCTSGSETETTGQGAEAMEVAAQVDPTNALRADLTIATENGGDVEIEVIDGEGDGFRLQPPRVEPGTYTVPLLGLGADTSYMVEVNDGEPAGSTSFMTGPLPSDMPSIEAEGSVVAEWSIFDCRDRHRRGTGTSILARHSRLQNSAGLITNAARDWTHANAVILDEGRNALLVSVRRLDQVFAVRYQDDDSGPAGELLWRLGEGGDFALTEGEWFLHPHAPQMLDDGAIMIYDNGNERPGTSLDDPESLPCSRAVQYEIDEENGTATHVWEHRADAPGEAVYAPSVGDADMPDGGTVLITHGGLLDPQAHSPRVEGVLPWARIVEVDYRTGDVVFDLTTKDPASESGWIVYRAERIGTIYPPEFTVEEIAG